MYTSYKPEILIGVEEICYEKSHIESVLKEISENISKFLDKFIETRGGSRASLESVNSMFGNGARIVKVSNNANYVSNINGIMEDAISDFLKDRDKYLNIFDKEALDEHEDDLNNFKDKVLRYECPVIHHTLENKKIKDLDKYRYNFNVADPEGLHTVIKNLYNFASKYVNQHPSIEAFDNCSDYKELNLSELENSDYTYSGVIGGGIRSMWLYKYSPMLFPYRSSNSIWALWYLTNKKTFRCSMDSEFLMIDTKKLITQQNYYYPYDLFSFYSLKIFNMIESKFKSYGVSINLEYRYVILDAFFDYIAKLYEGEILILKAKVKENGEISYV